MRIRLLAIGQKMPGWVEEAYHDYAKRIKTDCTLELLALPMPKRGKNDNIDKLVAKEYDSILSVINPNEKLVSLDVKGKPLSTEKLASKLESWQMEGDNIAFVIGGPDGLDKRLLQQSAEVVSLSALTLPHPLVRVLMAEQIYRAWSINKGHPYHR